LQKVIIKELLKERILNIEFNKKEFNRIELILNKYILLIKRYANCTTLNFVLQARNQK